MIRFLLRDNVDEPSIFNSKDPIAKIPTIPVTLIPSELKYSYETIINKFILASDSQVAIPIHLKNAIFARFAQQDGEMSTNVLEECIDSVLAFVYENVFKRYVEAIADQSNQQSQTTLSENSGERYSIDQSGRASSLSSSFKRRSGNGGLLDSALDDEYSQTNGASFGAAGGTLGSRLGKRASDNFVPASWKEDDDIGPSSLNQPVTGNSPRSFNQPVTGNSPRTPGSSFRSVTVNEPAALMLYTKPPHDDRHLNIILMDISGFIEHKDPHPIALEYSRACFVKLMDTSTAGYRDFSQFAKIHGYRNHIDFLDHIQKLDDTLASLTPVPPGSPPSLAKQYARARNEHAITQPLSRFIQSTPATDPSYTRLQKLPQLPPIPAHPVPSSLKTTFIDIYGTFIGRDSEQEIQFTPTRRPGVQSALQQDFSRPIESDLLDGCADDCLQVLFENAFRAYVIENGGRMNVLPTVAATSSSTISANTGEFIGVGTAAPLRKPNSIGRSDSFKKGNSTTSGKSWWWGRGKRHGSNSSSEVRGSNSPTASSCADQLMDVSLTHSSFVNTMRVDGPLFKEFKQFAENDQTHPEAIGNLNFYQAMCNIEDQIAATTPADSEIDAASYRTARDEGLNQTLTRFIKYTLETNPFGSGDLTNRTLVPPIPVGPIHSNLKSQCVDIFNTYVSENAPVQVSLTSDLRRRAKTAINEENGSTFTTNVFNDCMDQIVKLLYNQTFMRFVGAKNLSKGGLSLHPYASNENSSMKHEPFHQSTPQNSLTSILKSKSVSTTTPTLSVLNTGRKPLSSNGNPDSPSVIDSPLGGRVFSSPYLGGPPLLKVSRNPPPPLAPSSTMRSASRNKAMKPEKSLLV
ncbi:hypothetical protein BDR26DRAFT_851175 [Obelidium mucronatum]|nr:hypothetical protein BDR26DRAFT_851175 [Obelidium mucronatum]